MNFEMTINELLNYLTPNHRKNINTHAFKDIATVILNFHNEVNDLHNSKYVCNASMGHGKSTVITSYLKWITKQVKKQPILLCVREKQLAHEIYESVSSIAPNTIINITADNKELFEQDLYKYQIVIIQHERLKNMTLGYGNKYNYTYYGRKENKIKRKLIIDESPIFNDSVSYDISKSNNVLEWFDDLTENHTMQPLSVQRFKSMISYLVSEQLAENITDVTTALNKENVLSDKKIQGLKLFLKMLKEDKSNKNKYESLNALKHFEKLLDEDGYGRIDDYEFGKIGRKIIVSKYIDYSRMGMNIIIFDGTAEVTHKIYDKGEFELKRVENRNDYTRLELYNDQLNTSLYARSKKGNSTQETIANRIKQIQPFYDDMFVLPTKNEINTYSKLGVIKDNQIHLYKDDIANNTKGINLLNTTGKNCLNDVRCLYLTSLPKRNADYYKEIAISVYGNDVSLLTSEESDNGQWFQDSKLDDIYRYELYAELLQIIHRTALRNINTKYQIHIYLSFDDTPKDKFNYEHKPILDNINNYMGKNAVIAPIYKMYNAVDYGRDKKLDGFLEIIENMNIHKPVPIGKISVTFKRYINNHYNKKKDMIDNFLNENGYEIVEIKDSYSDNARYIKSIK